MKSKFLAAFAALALLAGGCVTSQAVSAKDPLVAYYASLADYNGAKRIALAYVELPSTTKREANVVVSAVERGDEAVAQVEVLRAISGFAPAYSLRSHSSSSVASSWRFEGRARCSMPRIRMNGHAPRMSPKIGMCYEKMDKCACCMATRNWQKGSLAWLHRSYTRSHGGQIESMGNMRLRV
ncbi:MAG: hypothetical protein HC923_01155 [Myxococcales bacterium]|nr:hypothetical protein [Myxococcales bacterium]